MTIEYSYIPNTIVEIITLTLAVVFIFVKLIDDNNEYDERLINYIGFFSSSLLAFNFILLNLGWLKIIPSIADIFLIYVIFIMNKREIIGFGGSFFGVSILVGVASFIIALITNSASLFFILFGAIVSFIALAYEVKNIFGDDLEFIKISLITFVTLSLLNLIPPIKSTDSEPVFKITISKEQFRALSDFLEKS